APHYLTVDELVTIDMRPDAVGIRPTGGERRGRLDRSFRRPFRFSVLRRLGLQNAGRREAGEKSNEQNGAYHNSFSIDVSLRARLGATIAGTTVESRIELAERSVVRFKKAT